MIDVLKERTQAYLTDYFRQKGEGFLAHIEVFSSDMWDGFINVATTLMPNAVMVIDRFHVMRNLHKALAEFRRSLRRISTGVDVLKPLRWPLLQHPATLTEAERTQLEQVYQLKEDFRRWYDGFACPHQAATWLEQWLDQARALEHPAMNTFVGTVTRWKASILNFFHHHITNGLVEGINNVITLIKRRAFGSLNFEHFRLRVLTECR